MVTEQVQNRSRASSGATVRNVRLEPVRGCHGLEPTAIGPGTCRIGSSPECDVWVAIGGVAALHCTIENDGQRVRVVANNPLTWLNDGPVRQSQLKAGDVLTLGPVEFKVRFVDAPAALQEPASDFGAETIESEFAGGGRRSPIAEPTAWASPSDERAVAPPQWKSTHNVGPQTVSPPPRLPRPMTMVTGAATGRSPISRAWERIAPPDLHDDPAELLAEAQAAHDLRQDLARLERDLAGQRARLERPAPRTPATDKLSDELRALRTQLAERERDLGARTEALRTEQSVLVREREVVQLEQQRLDEGLREIDALRVAFESEQTTFAETVRAARQERDEWRKEREAQRGQMREIQQRLDEQLRHVRESETAIAAEQATLAERMAACAERSAELDTRAETLRQRAAELDIRQATFERTVAQGRERDNEFDRLHVEIEQGRQQLAEQRVRLGAEQSDLAREQSELRREQGRQEQNAERLAALQDDLTRREREIDWRTQELSDREASLETRRAALEATSHTNGATAAPADAPTTRDAAEIAALLSELTTARSDLCRISEERDRLRREFEQFQTAHSQSAHVTDELASEHDWLSADREELQTLRGDLDRQHAELNEERNRIAAARDTLRIDRDAAVSEQGRLAELQQRIAAERQELQAELDRLVEERRWSSEQSTAMAVMPSLGTDAVSSDADGALEPPGHESGSKAAARPELGSEIIDALADARDEGCGRDLPDDTQKAGPHRDMVRNMPASYLEFLEELHVGIGERSEKGAAEEEPAEAASPAKSDTPAVGQSTDGQYAPSVRDERTSGGSHGEGNAEPVTELRSKLAELFGISQAELNQAAEREGHAEATSASRTGAGAPVENPSPRHEPVPSAGVSGREPAADDSVSAYMAQLLARTNQSSSQLPASPPPPVPEKKTEKKTWSNDDLKSVLNEIVEEARVASPSPVVDATPPRQRKKLDAVEKEELRSNLDSMRQIANFSARSAVAQHHSRKLGVSFQVKLTLTIISGIVTAVLLTADLWGPNSYRWQGLGTLIITLISAFELSRTVRTIHQVHRKASQTDVEGAGEEGPATPAQEMATIEPR